jgi:hypothetical protein
LLCCRLSQTVLGRGSAGEALAAPWPHLSPISVVVLLVAIIIYELLFIRARAPHTCWWAAALALAFYFSHRRTHHSELAAQHPLPYAVFTDRYFCG